MKKPSLYKGLPLVDGVDDIEINVVKDDVKHAQRNNPNKCAAALASSRILKAEVEVHISRTYVKKGKKWHRYLTPHSISREITSFDRSNIFETGCYVLKAPTKSQKLGQGRGRNHKNTNTGNKKKQSRHITTNIREAAK